MGNFLWSKKPKNPDTFSAKKPTVPTVILEGDPINPTTHHLRFSLLYKPLSLRFLPSNSPSFNLRFDSGTASDSVTGSAEAVLRFVESKLPNPALFTKEREEGEGCYGVRMAELQHKSMRWHLDRVTTWGKDIETRGWKLGRWYGKLLEVMLEHAQMEELLIFPLLRAAHPGACRCVTEEHARDLPLMNGINEDIKSIGVLDAGTSNHREALCILSARLKALQDNCRAHFSEEEKNLFPLMEAAELTRDQQRKLAAQCIVVMEGTHSHLFRFFIEGLLPHEAMEYLYLVMDCVDKEKVASMLRLLVD